METNENYGAFNGYFSGESFRVDTSGTKPSNYITRVKLKRAVIETADKYIAEIFGKEMKPAEVKSSREKLIQKIERLYEWQLLVGLNILLKDGNYDTVEFIHKCKRSDKEPN